MRGTAARARSAPIRKKVYSVPLPRTCGPWGFTAGGVPTIANGGGPESLGKEDSGGPAGDVLPMRTGCPLNPDPPDGPHTGGGLS
ncbi:hypothetical protein NDU88_002104 [Pleurodeles waltl]|uniref:Uncharacterized protein n=1 Tax=Pleurodeles waltl TaxID=8319 RepID=A0AAV7UUL1_PLEWA|nr:hypothetical protein NDU88_002104 [Pleurodeles waltl]